MNFKRTIDMPRAVLAALAAAFLLSSPAAAQGSLVIVGGGLDPANDQVFGAFIARIPTDAPGIVIIPSASDSPATSARLFAGDLVRHGVDPARIATVRIATQDDPDTTEDEAAWRSNANNPDEIAKIAHAGAIWFTGGDQARTTAALVQDDGRDTPMLAAIRSRLAAGAVIGGSSAGAAIMSDPMIMGGDSLGALLGRADGEALAMGRGIGFLVGPLVDQHFDARARLGRLAVALGRRPAAARIGFGIDEDTALIVDQKAQSAAVVGAGYVTLLDARDATYAPHQRIAIDAIRLGLAASGDQIDLANLTIRPARWKRATMGREYHKTAVAEGGGMAMAGQGTAAVVGEALIDNSAARRIERLSFAGDTGVIYRFEEDDRTQGWWGRDDDGNARYSASGVQFSIRSIKVKVEEIGE